MCKYMRLYRLLIIYTFFSCTGPLCPSNLHGEAAVVRERDEKTRGR